MIREFRLPDVGEGVAEGEIVEWLVAPGDPVSEDQPVVEVETDKALVEIPSPYDGTVHDLHAEPGDVVPVGEVVISFDVPDEGDAAAAGEAAPREAGAETGPAESGSGAAGAESSGAPAASTDESGAEPETEAEPDAEAEQKAELEPDAEAEQTAELEPDAEVEPEAPEEDGPGPTARPGGAVAPPSVRRLARELGVDLDAVPGSGPGGRVTEADVRAAADGADEGAPGGPDASARDATTAGTDAGAGDAAESGGGDTGGPDADAADATGERETEATGSEGDAAAAAAEPEAVPVDEAGGPAPAGRERTLAAPATRRLAEEAGVDLDDVPTDETREGEAFVTAEQVRAYAAARAEAAGTSAETAPVVLEGTVPALAGGDAAAGEGPSGERVPYRGVRRTIGEHMERAKFTAPHVTHHDVLDATDLVALREELNEASSVRLTYLPLVTKAVVAGLREFPYVNAQLDEDRGEIVLRDEYNVGVATATDAGLMVPVIEDADAKGLEALAREIGERTDRARERTITREELQGGTFTITNVGTIGGEYATPIVNYPEVAVLALGAIRDRPHVVDGEVVARKTLPLSLSVDHRVVDGAVAARFTNHVKELLANPTRLLLELD